jgi:hypothetical protein
MGPKPVNSGQYVANNIKADNRCKNCLMVTNRLKCVVVMNGYVQLIQSYTRDMLIKRLLHIKQWFMNNFYWRGIWGIWYQKCPSVHCEKVASVIVIIVTILVCLFIYLSMALQSFVGPWPLFHFFNPWTGDQPVTRPLPIHRMNAYRHPCLEWGSNPWSQQSSKRRQFVP